MTNATGTQSAQNDTCISRRSVLSGASALALATAALRMRSVLAEDGTPVATPTEAASWLFTQTFTGGDWDYTDDPARFTLNLRGGLASTVGFTDRPNRDFMVMPTPDLLPKLWEDPSNPPNAAIIVEDAGTQYTFLLVLNDPVYDDAGDMITYTVSVLDSYTGDGLGAAVERVKDGTLPQSFGAGAIFIDSLCLGCCPNAKACRQVVDSTDCMVWNIAFQTADGYLPESVQTTTTCSCGGCDCTCDQSYWDDWCNTTYPDYCYALNDKGCVFMTWDGVKCAH